MQAYTANTVSRLPTAAAVVMKGAAAMPGSPGSEAMDKVWYLAGREAAIQVNFLGILRRLLLPLTLKAQIEPLLI
jgi:hypothetical protein